MKYRKKPVVVEAIQWNGRNLNEIKAFCPGLRYEIYGAAWQCVQGTPIERVSIPTPEVDMNVSKGDYIIKDASGEFHPCKPFIFEKTYEPVKE